MLTSSTPSAETILLHGTHGTTKARAAMIQSKGIIGGRGRGGTGAYFWRDDGRFAEDLAREWFRDQATTGSYSDELQPECAVIFAEIEILNSEKLNLEDPAIKDKLAEFLEKNGYGYDPEVRELCGAHDALVNLLEAKIGYKFKVLETRVAPPRSSRYPMRALGAPIVYICRRPKPSWVRIIKVNY